MSPKPWRLFVSDPRVAAAAAADTEMKGEIEFALKVTIEVVCGNKAIE